MKTTSSEYKALKEFSSLKDFGYEYYNVKTDDKTVHSVGVGREGLRFCDATGSVIRRYNIKITKPTKRNYIPQRPG